MRAGSGGPDAARASTEVPTAPQAGSDASLDRLQKLAVVEQLAGGIAHDCNNAFQNILASMELVRKLIATGRGPESERFIASAMSSAQRAAASIQLWFNFARAVPAVPRVVAAGETLAQVGELFRRSLPTPTGVDLDLAPDLWDVSCDPQQLQTSVLALAIHARDASADDRPIVIRGRNTDVDAHAAGAGAMHEGQYLSVSVTYSDAGGEASRRAFDAQRPDQANGQQSTIDLSSVRRFARQNGGDATLARGGIDDCTTITLFLPHHVGSEDAPA